MCVGGGEEGEERLYEFAYVCAGVYAPCVSMCAFGEDWEKCLFPLDPKMNKSGYFTGQMRVSSLICGYE